MKILLKKATIIDSRSAFHAQKKDVLIENGKIAAIDNTLDEHDCQIIEKKNLHISRGWFDSSVCFGEPGYEERETIAHGLHVAALSGFTAIVLNSNTLPCPENHAHISHLLKVGKGHTCQLFASGCLTVGMRGEHMADLFDMHQAGAVAFGDYKQATSQVNIFKIALDYVQSFKGLLLAYPREPQLGALGQMHEGIQSTQLGLPGIPEVSETIALSRDLQLIAYTGGKLHIPFISSKESLSLIRDAKKSGLDVTCGVALAHLIFTDEALSEFDANFKFFPPLRSAEDREALRAALLDGSIDLLSAMHEPRTIEEKKVEFTQALDGSIGLETAFGALHALFGLEDTVQILTRGRLRFGIPETEIAIGAPADLTLFEPESENTLKPSHLISTSKNCAFVGLPLKGRVYGSIREDKITIHGY